VLAECKRVGTQLQKEVQALVPEGSADWDDSAVQVRPVIESRWSQFASECQRL
jgi:hypothetical protein